CAPSKQFTATTNGTPRRSKKSTEAKQVSSRRVSAITIAPRAPWDSSSHMNQKRSCPGVPNRYRTRLSLIVIRPKSSATVVVDLASTPDSSSAPYRASVLTSSVLKGAISLTEPTMVVLPAPKPPAMRIFRAEGTVERSSVSESVDAIENRLEYVPADRALGFVGGTGQGEPAVEEVTEQGLDDGDRDVQVGGHLGHRLGASTQLE